MKFTRTRSRKAKFLGTLLWPVGLLLGFGITYLFLNFFITVSQPAAMPKPTQVDLVAELMDRHGCWVGEAPDDMQGKFPGHVLVTQDGVLHRSRKLVGPALEQALGGEVTKGLTVHAFCR